MMAMSSWAADGFVGPSRPGGTKRLFPPDAWQEKFCWRSARFRTLRPRVEFQINSSPKNSPRAQISCLLSNRSIAGKKTSRPEVKYWSFSSLANIDNQRFKKNCVRFIPTKFRKLFLFRSPPAYPNMYAGLRIIAPGKLGLERAPYFKIKISFLAWADTFILERGRQRFSRSMDRRGACPSADAASITRT